MFTQKLAHIEGCTPTHNGHIWFTHTQELTVTETENASLVQETSTPNQLLSTSPPCLGREGKYPQRWTYTVQRTSHGMCGETDRQIWDVTDIKKESGKGRGCQGDEAEVVTHRETEARKQGLGCRAEK